MPDDLPVYSESILRSRQQFIGLERLEPADFGLAWSWFDQGVEHIEGGRDALGVLASAEPSKQSLLLIHATVFEGRSGAGCLRPHRVDPMFRGQDCPDPEHIGRSLDNLAKWFTADSFADIHPIEKSALVLVRLVDIWPFEFGSLTAALVFSNLFLYQAGYAPFFVLSEHGEEFRSILERAILMETQPLVNAIESSIRRETNRLAKK